MRGGREHTVPMGVNHMLSEDPITSRKVLVEMLIDTQGAPEIRGRELVWNLELIASREARQAPQPRSPKRPDGSTPGAFGRKPEKDELREAAAELGIDLSGVRAS